MLAPPLIALHWVWLSAFISFLLGLGKTSAVQNLKLLLLRIFKNVSGTFVALLAAIACCAAAARAAGATRVAALVRAYVGFEALL